MQGFSKSFIWAVVGIFMAVSVYVGAETVSYFGKGAADQLGVSLITLLAGEDQTNDVIRVEEQYNVCIDDADKVCKAEAGFLHSVWCYAEDAAATAGTVRVTNTATAGGAETTEVWGDDFAAAAYRPVGAVLDIAMSTGIVIDFTTTADVKCAVSYR